LAATAAVSAAASANGRACTQFEALKRVFPAASAMGFVTPGITVRVVRRSGGHSIYWPGSCKKRWWFASYSRGAAPRGVYAVEVTLTPFNTHEQALAALTEPAMGPVERLDNGAVVRRSGPQQGAAGRWHAAMASVYRNVFISSWSQTYDHLVSLSAQERLHRRIHAGVLGLR
jgi:hypothetical protein